jgi:hypothetical protein
MKTLFSLLAASASSLTRGPDGEKFEVAERMATPAPGRRPR